MSYEIRIPTSKLTEEGFAALKAQMRIFLGMPADVMPRSPFDLYVVFGAYTSNKYPFLKWLRDNGYEVVRPEFKSIPKAYYVIRRADVETIMYDNMSRSIMEDIDKAVLQKIKGER